MNLATALVITALVASIVLVLQSRPRLFPVIALVAASLETLFVLKLVSIRTKGFDLWLILGLALIVGGAVTWMKSSARTPVTAATLVTFVGAIQVLLAIL